MTKLKTLKDILGNEMWRNEVKKGAIEWVKNWVGSEVGKRRFMDFHNITEEDLK